ncbi:MAG: hypothetical protein AB9M53_04920 [Leptothrix sp. (in: b-proteobacteria)]
MALPTLSAWKTATHKWFSIRNGSIGLIDDCLKAYHEDGLGKKRSNLRKLRRAVELFMEEKIGKYGDYKKSAREGESGNITSLYEQILDEFGALGGDADLNIARYVGGTLLDVKIADVDFSEGVTAAAKAKTIGGRTLYQIVKAEWDTADQDRDSPRAQLDRAMMQLKMPFGGSQRKKTESIAQLVLQHRFAVCESIAATIIHLCKAKNFQGRLECIGIPYPGRPIRRVVEGVEVEMPGKSISGHQIVVGLREGTLNQPDTWGDDFFIVDMWYYNLGMRNVFVHFGAAAREYVRADVQPYLDVSPGLKATIDTDTW